MEVPNTVRIVLLGKSGSGSSSLANTIFGENYFKINSCSDSETSFSQSKTKPVHNRLLTLIDTSGLFHPGASGKDKKACTLSCIAECAPAVNAFLIVLKVEKFTEQENAVITQICELFLEDALEYAAVVFTRGDQLPEGMTIHDFVIENKGLRELVEKCGGRCHVLDNKYWKWNKQDEYRSNQFQVAELLKSIDQIVMTHGGRSYTKAILQEVESEIKKEVELIRQSENMLEEEIREQAKSRVIKKRLQHSWLRWLMRFVMPGFLAVVIGVIAAKFLKSMNPPWTDWSI